VASVHTNRLQRQNIDPIKRADFHYMMMLSDCFIVMFNCG